MTKEEGRNSSKWPCPQQPSEAPALSLASVLSLSIRTSLSPGSHRVVQAHRVPKQLLPAPVTPADKTVPLPPSVLEDRLQLLLHSTEEREESGF